jgi:replicative DNA helicase
MAESFAQKSEHTVNYFSLEMKGAELVLRMFSAMNNLDSEGLRDGSYIKEMENGSQKFMDYLSTIDLEISEFKGYRFEEIVSVMEKHYDEKKPDIIFIDFVQMIDKSESETEKMALDSYMRKLKELAKKHSMGVVIVSQLRRLPSGADYNREPEITDLLGSGGLEQIADKVILLYRVIQENQDIKYYLNLAKNRQGREIKQEVIFDGAHSRFKEIELSPMERKVKQEFSGQQI